MNCAARLSAGSESITTRRISLVIRSRIDRSSRSLSEYSGRGLFPPLRRRSMSFHRRIRYARSRFSSALVRSNPAVRRMNPNPSGRSSWLRISLAARRRSSSSSLRDTPTLSIPGIITRNRPGIDR